MIINTQIQVEDFKDYEENQSQLIGLKFECQDLVYDVNYSEFLDCPLDGLEIIFLNTLKRYSFGTKEIETKEGDVRSIPKDFDSIEEIESFLHQNGYFYAPVYAYIHGGIALSLSNSYQFSDRFDSGFAGFLCVRKDKLREIHSVKRLSKKILDKEFELWKALIEETNYWLNGDIYSVQVETKEGEFVDCFTSYGLYDLSKNMEKFMERNKAA